MHFTPFLGFHLYKICATRLRNRSIPQLDKVIERFSLRPRETADEDRNGEEESEYEYDWGTSGRGLRAIAESGIFRNPGNILRPGHYAQPLVACFNQKRLLSSH
jgi:hypothetical protein